MVPFTLRAAGPADARELTRVQVLCWKQTYSAMLPAGFFTPEHEASRLAQWRRVLADPACQVALAEGSDGGLLGFAMAAKPFGEAAAGLPVGRQLYSLYVLAEHHGTGAGRALLDAVLGTAPAVLWVAQGNARAIAFYRRNGFAPDGTTMTDPAIPGITEVRMLRVGQPPHPGSVS